MSTDTKQGRRTTRVPVTTMEEVPIFDERERAELVDSLKQAEADIRSGKAVDYEPEAFKDRLVRIYKGKTK